MSTSARDDVGIVPYTEFSNNVPIICQQREFILLGFTFYAICDTLHKNKSKGIIL